MKKIIAIIFIFLFSFSAVYASVEIREIMYNPEGSDTNREWVEIYNNGPSVDISSWYFFENDTYHGLYPDGFSSLESNERALIVKDSASIRSELGSNIKYIKSSFSLNNTGEPLSIADESKVHINSYTYNSNSGANGDGQSLQLVNSSWVSANPTPGMVNILSGDSSDTSSDENNDNGNNTSIVKESYYEPKVVIPDTILAKTDFKLLAEVTHVKNGNRIRKLGGYYYINFGDGKSLESDRRIETNYNYKKPGNYIIVFEYYSSRFSFENGDDPDAFIKKNISIVDNNIEIIDVSQSNGVILKNNTSSLIDLSSWKITWMDKVYIFPRYSYINIGENITILSSTLGFSPIQSLSNKVQLLSNANEIVSVFPSKKRKSSASSTDFKKGSNYTYTNNGLSEEDENKNYDSNFFGTPDSYLEQYLSDNPDKLEVDFGDGEESLLTASVYDASRQKRGKNNSIFYALGSLLIIIGVARFTKHKTIKESQQGVKDNDFGTIEIIE